METVKTDFYLLFFFYFKVIFKRSEFRFTDIHQSIKQWITCKMPDALTLHWTHCVHTVTNVRKINFISNIYIMECNLDKNFIIIHHFTISNNSVRQPKSPLPANEIDTSIALHMQITFLV